MGTPLVCVHSVARRSTLRARGAPDLGGFLVRVRVHEPPLEAPKRDVCVIIVRVGVGGATGGIGIGRWNGNVGRISIGRRQRGSDDRIGAHARRRGEAHGIGTGIVDNAILLRPPIEHKIMADPLRRQLKASVARRCGHVSDRATLIIHRVSAGAAVLAMRLRDVQSGGKEGDASQ